MGDDHLSNNEMIKNQINAMVHDKYTITVQPYARNDRDDHSNLTAYQWNSNSILPPINPLYGMQFLSRIEQLEIEQIVDLSTLLGTREKGNQYRIRLPRAETVFLGIESRTENARKFFGQCRNFQLSVIDQTGETVFTVKNQSNWNCIPSTSNKITVENTTDLIGSVEQNFSALGPNFTVYDETRNPICNLFGPNIFSCCMYKDVQFQVISIIGKRQIGSLSHQWDPTIRDYLLSVTFLADTNVRLKSLLIGAIFLLDILYFERVKEKYNR